MPRFYSEAFLFPKSTTIKSAVICHTGSIKGREG